MWMFGRVLPEGRRAGRVVQPRAAFPGAPEARGPALENDASALRASGINMML